MGVVYVNKTPYPRCFSYQGETKDLQAKVLYEGDAKELGRQSTVDIRQLTVRRRVDWPIGIPGS